MNGLPDAKGYVTLPVIGNKDRTRMLAKLKQLFRALRYQRQLREAISTQLSLLEEDASFALGGLTEEEEQFMRARVRECVGAMVTKHADGEGEGEKVGPIVEFGTLFGLTTRLIAAEAGSKMDVITVDNFSWNPFGLPPVLHETFTRKILRTELDEGRVSLSVADSGAFRAEYSGRVPSMVFLDADHSYGAVRDEIAWAKKLGVPWICGHDYGNPSFGVTRAVDEAFPVGVQTRGMVWSYCDH